MGKCYIADIHPEIPTSDIVSLRVGMLGMVVYLRAIRDSFFRMPTDDGSEKLIGSVQGLK